MLTGVKFRTYPTKEQANTLSQWIGCARLVYNEKVSQERDSRQQGQTHVIDQSYAFLKTKELPSQILRNSATRWYGAYQRHLKGLGGRPTFKKRGDHDSVWLTNELFSFHQRELQHKRARASVYPSTKRRGQEKEEGLFLQESVARKTRAGTARSNARGDEVRPCIDSSMLAPSLNRETPSDRVSDGGEFILLGFLSLSCKIKPQDVRDFDREHQTNRRGL